MTERKTRVFKFVLVITAILFFSGLTIAQISIPTPILTDTAPPATITDLKLTDIYPNGQVGLNWRAPYEDSDDPTSGSVAVYDIRYDLKTPLADSTWSRAAQVADEPLPRAPGTVEIYILSNLTPGETYYVAMRSQDAAGNVSVLSNNLLITVPEPLIVEPIVPITPAPIEPSPIIDPDQTQPITRDHNISAVLFYPSVWADYGSNRTSVDYDNVRDVFRDIKSIGFNSLLIVPLRADRNQVEIDNYVAWLKANVLLAKQEGLSSIVGIPFFYLFDPPKANILTGYDLEYWNWVKGQDRVALIKQFIDEMSGVAGVTDIYWSVELAGTKNESRGEYLHLNYDLAKILKDYSNDRGLGLIHLTGSTHSDSYFINADGNFDVMGPNAHEILGCGETGECRYLRNIQRVTDKSILKETEGIYNLEIRGDFRDYPRNQNQGDKQLMTESFARQLTAVKEYKPQHISVYYYDRITPYHILGVLYPEIREMLADYFVVRSPDIDEPPPPPEPPPPEDIVPPPPPPAGGGSSGGGSSGGSTVQTPPAGAPGAVMSDAARIAVLRARLLELIKTLLELLRQRLEQLLILRGWR